jgi:hypothetical protein
MKTASKTKHTPGPWTITNQCTAENIFYIGCRSGSLGSAYNKAGGEGEANARLIAAAPNLLECLKNALVVIEVTAQDADTRLVKEIKHAIEQAEG